MVFTARVASAGAAFLATILVARYLGPERYGPYAVLLAAVSVASGLISPALDTGMVRYMAQARDGAHALAAWFFRLKARLALATLAAGLALAIPLHRLLLSTPDAATPGPSAFVIVFLSASVMVMWSSVQAWCQAGQRFPRFALQEAATSLLRLGWVVMVMAIGGLGERTLLAGYGAAAAVIGIAGAMAMPREVWRAPNPPRAARREMLLFTQWVVLACFATSLVQRLDVFLLAAYETPAATLGHYGAALNLVVVGELVIMTLFQVLLPKASALTDPLEWQSFLKRHQRSAVAAGVLLLPLSAAGGMIAALVFGEDYAAAGPFFGVLLVGTAFTLSCAPAGAVLYAAGRSRVVALLELAKLIGTLAAGLAVVPLYGALGMACAVAAVRGITAVLTYAVARLVIAREVRAQGGTNA